VINDQPLVLTAIKANEFCEERRSKP